MLGKILTFEEFKKTIDTFDAIFKDIVKKLNDIDQKYQKESDNVKKQGKDYVDNLISNRISLFSDFLKKVKTHPLLTNIDRSKLSNIDISSEKKASFNATNIDAALDDFNAYIDEYRDLSEKLNGYNFSTGLDFSFNQEELVVNNQKYTAPNFPKLNLSDFDTTDPIFKKLILLTIDCLERMIKALEYIVSYYSSVTYRQLAEKKMEKSLEPAFHDVDIRKIKEEETLNKNLYEYYENECSPFMNKNNKSVRDYIKMDNLSMSNSFSELINIGSITHGFANFDFYKDKVKKLDRWEVVEKEVRFPYYLNLKDKGNILINTNKIDKDVIDFVYQLVLQYIASAPLRKVNLALADVDQMDAFDFVSSFNKQYLKENSLIFGGKPVGDEDEFRTMLNSLFKKINDIKGDKLAPKNCNNVFDYNKISKENTQELYVMVYVNCPKCLDESIAEKITSVMFNGPKCGVFSIILNNTSYKLPNDNYGYNQASHKQFIDNISKYSVVFNYSGSKYIVDNKENFIPNKGLKEKDVNDFFDSLKEEAETLPLTNNISLKELAQQSYDRGDYSKRLKVPVGKNGGDVVYFELDVESSNISSAVIAGGTGSGKSTFLHTIILSAAYNYSPDELEFYLADFKDGIEFAPYAKKDAGLYIPHVTYLSLNSKPEDAYDLLLKIRHEAIRRHALFTKAGSAKNIKEYQASPKVKNGELPSLKRLVVLIDEYQNFLDNAVAKDPIICTRCQDLLTKLLGEIRASGISIVLASQGIALNRDSLSLINNRYVLGSAPNVIQYAFPDAPADEMSVELFKEKGLVYKTDNGGSKRELFKAAYGGESGKQENLELIKMINDKWNNVTQELIIAGSTEPLPIYEAKAPFVTFEKMEQDDDYNIPIYFGQSAISNELSFFNFSDADFCSYLVIGSIKNSRRVEASIGLSFLYALKQFDYELDKNCLVYLDLNDTKDAIRNPSPFFTYQDELEGLISYALEAEEVVDAVNELYQEFLRRKEKSRNRRNRDIDTPRLLIVNSYSFLEKIEEFNVDNSLETSTNLDDEDDLSGLDDFGDSSTTRSDLSLEEMIKVLYEDGHAYDIYVVLHEKRSALFKKNDDFVKMHRVICLDKDEIANCMINENGDGVDIDELPETYAVLFPDVSKVRPYDFDNSKQEKEYINKLIGALKDE